MLLFWPNAVNLHNNVHFLFISYVDLLVFIPIGTAFGQPIIWNDITSSQAYLQIWTSEFELGKDVGVLSFNEKPLKDLLDITVVRTDFERMGKTAAGH